jgi:hypothetical protein
VCILQTLLWPVTRKFNDYRNSGFNVFVSFQSKGLEMCAKSNCEKITESIYRYFHSYIRFHHKKKARSWSVMHDLYF